jgi:leucyl aminopeptidase (aminopeptidase T)
MDPPTPNEADRLARRVLTTRLHLKPNENVTIEAYPTALPWAAGFVREARRLGARPLVHYEDEASYWAAVEEGKGGIIGQPGKHEWAELAETDVYIYFWGPEDQRRFNALPDSTIGKLIAFNAQWYKTAGKAGVRGARMGLARVTEVNARYWGVPAEAWQKEVVAGSMIDPQQFVASARKLSAAFERGKEVRLRHANGTDLTLKLAGRKARAALGWVTPESKRAGFGFMANVPDGSVYVAVDESTAEGTLVSNRMTAPFGVPVRGGRWTFRDGRLVEQNYDDGAASVREGYAEGGRGRDLPAMLEVGLDPSVRISPNLEENERGAVSIGAGSNVGFGGKTRCNFMAHLTVAGAELSIDSRPIVRGGRLV